MLIIIVILNSWSECMPFRFWLKTENNGNDVIKVMCFNISCTSYDINPKVEKLTKLIFDHKPDVLFVAEISDTNKPVLDSLLNSKPSVNPVL